MVPFLNFNIICLIQVFLIKEIRESCGKHHSDVHHFLEDNYLKKSLTHFDFLQPQNVSAILGKTAFLTCVVKNLKPTQKVSWVRHRDVHILTAGEQTFTSDQRFSSKHNTEDQWVLLIKYVQVCWSQSSDN